MHVDGTREVRARLYLGNSNNFSNIYNFTDNVLRGATQSNPSSLDLFNVQGQTYIGLIWQPRLGHFQYDLIRQVDGSKFENYSSVVIRTGIRSAKYVDYNSILVHDTSCQIVNVNPINPMALKQGV
jgi:hypothetical protein